MAVVLRGGLVICIIHCSPVSGNCNILDILIPTINTCAFTTTHTVYSGLSGSGLPANPVYPVKKLGPLEFPISCNAITPVYPA